MHLSMSPRKRGATSLVSMKQKREQKYNFMLENKIIYGKSIVNKSRAENLILFYYFAIDVVYLVFMICISHKT